MAPASALMTLAAFVSGVETGRAPTAVLDKARLCLVDGLAAPLAALAAGRNHEAIAALAPRGESSQGAGVFGAAGARATVDTAAFLNASTAACAISNDTHLASASHPGMVVIPSVLAVAESERIGGADVLAAIIAGYETMIRVGAVVVTPDLSRRFRPTGLTGPLGAAAAIARLCRLSPEQTANAIALAANAFAGLTEWANAGTGEHVLHAGMAARNGVTMARLARGGVQAAASTLDGASGFFSAFDALERLPRLCDGLGVTWRILEVVHKPAPACVFVQAPCALALRLAASPGFSPSAIKAVEIAVSRQAAGFPGCDNRGPVRSGTAAEQSLQFSVAAVLTRGRIELDDWARPEAANVDSLALRTQVVVDAEVAGRSGSGARVTLQMADGRWLTASAAAFDGMSAPEVESRFYATASGAYGRTGADRLVRAIASIERAGGVERLAAALWGGGPPAPDAEADVKTSAATCRGK